MGSVGKFNLKTFEDSLENYVGGGYSVTGAFNKQELDYIKKNMESTTSSLYRVEDINWTAKDLDVGAIINFNDDLKSFTKSTSGVADILQDGEEWGTYETPVVFKTSGKTQYFDVQSAMNRLGNSTYDYQQEVFVKGKKWEIKSIGTAIFNGRRVTVITIR